MIQMMCNRVAWTCGCAVWLELEGSAWVSKSWRCNRHDFEPGPLDLREKG